MFTAGKTTNRSRFDVSPKLEVLSEIIAEAGAQCETNNVWVRCCLHTPIFLGPIGLRLQLAEPNGKQITSHSSIIRGAYWVKITAGKKTAAVLRRRRSRSLT